MSKDKVTKKDGNQSPAELVSPVAAAERLPGGSLAQRQAPEDPEEKLQNPYLNLYELAPVGYLTLNAAGFIEEINLTGAVLLGRDRSKLWHRLFAPFVVAEDRDRWWMSLMRATWQEENSGCEIRLQRDDGTTVDVRLEYRRIVFGDKEALLLVVLTDISELKHALADLQTKEERLRLAKEATGLGIFDRDIASGRLEWDEEMRAIWGVGPGEPVSFEVFIEGVHPEDRCATRAAIERALDPHGDGTYHAEYRVVSRADGRVRHVMADGRAAFRNGQAIRFTGMVRDVTARKQMERELQERRNELELLLKQQVAVQTAAAIAHELNQPLTSISVYSETALLMVRNGIQSPQKLARALKGAIEQAHQAGDTLHELMDFLHHREAAREPVDLNAVVRESLEIVNASGYGGFRPVVELDPDLPPVLANRLQLEKVLVNLLHNGVDAMRGIGMPSAAITIRVKTLAGKSMAQVTIQDSGPGLDAETAQRIFEPFFTTKPQGLGFGLTISRALIEAFGGQLWLDPEAGPGATFHFTLPFVT